MPYQCSWCGQNEFGSQYAVNGHQRTCKQKSSNKAASSKKPILKSFLSRRMNLGALGRPQEKSVHFTRDLIQSTENNSDGDIPVAGSSSLSEPFVRKIQLLSQQDPVDNLYNEMNPNDYHPFDEVEADDISMFTISPHASPPPPTSGHEPEDMVLDDSNISGPVETQRRKNQRPYQDILPAYEALLPADGFDDHSIPFQTRPDQFGLFRVYPHGKPSYTPDSVFTIGHMTDSSNLQSKIVSCATTAIPPSTPSPDSHNDISPEPQMTFGDIFGGNKSQGLFMNWALGGNSNTTSKARCDDLIKNVLQHPDFKKEEMAGFRMDSGLKAIDNYQASTSRLPIQDHWMSNGSVMLSVPCDGFEHLSEEDAPKFTVTNIQTRKLVDVIRSAFYEPAAEFFHISGYLSYQAPLSPNQPPIQQFDEIYSTQTFIDEQDHVTKVARAEGCTTEVVVVALLLGSDSTRIANFGTQSLWPIYLWFGNLSKYIRGKASTFSAHHIGYIPKLPDHFQDWYKETFGIQATAETLSHMRCELFHAIWTLLLDDDFKHAYLHGIDIVCWDTVIRRIFPRFFTYSMDYMEKIIYTCIKHLSDCLCPECLARKINAYLLGTRRDMLFRLNNPRTDNETVRHNIEEARRLLYVKGKSFTSKAVKNQLSEFSLRPIRNAFSKRLSDTGFDAFKIVAPDFMHEFELGVWKATFTHLLRILIAEGSGKIHLLNSRYRNILTFGKDTIRKFSNNVSGMSKMTAGNFEDLLQCSIPVFTGLLPAPHGLIVRKLLFELCTWQALAKLRRHNTVTIVEFEASTFRLGQALRHFKQKTCKEYNTQKLPSEESARGSKKRKVTTESNSTKKKVFNMATFKIHGLGHHPQYISYAGTSDNYSSWMVELEHKRTKINAGKASRVRERLGPGVVKNQRRQRMLYNAEQSWLLSQHKNKVRQHEEVKNTHIAFLSTDKLPKSDPTSHHDMSMEANPQNRINLKDFIRNNDPAIDASFIKRLRSHLLARILGVEYDDDENQFAPQQLSDLVILNDCIYEHQILRINYTTYDLRRCQDTINPNTHPDIMVLATDTGNHPYWYARVLGVFHVRVLLLHPGGKRSTHDMPFVWVRWFGLDTCSAHGWKAKNLPRVGFIDIDKDDSPAFGFVDPSQIVRAVHLIADENAGRTTNGLGSTLIRRDGCDDDWAYYYVNMFVDRDMFMRYRGGGIGHVAVREATNHFLNDRDDVDREYLTRHANGERVTTPEELQEEIQNMVDMSDDESNSEDEENEDGNNDEGCDGHDDDPNEDDESEDEHSDGYYYDGLHDY